MIHMTNRPYIDMRLIALVLGLGHLENSGTDYS